MSKLKTIQARISVRLLEAVDREAKARTVTRSEVIRTAITREMERVDSWPQHALTPHGRQYVAREALVAARAADSDAERDAMIDLALWLLGGADEQP